MEIIIGGIYEHFKGMHYRVLAIATHSETLEKLVVYEALYQNDISQIWCRPESMFCETLERDGITVPRFTLVG